jgi:hypothetical protein
MKKAVLTVVAFVLMGAAVFGTAALAVPGEVSVPQRITGETPCPVAGCTQPDGACHAGALSPVPDGSFVMECPKARGCSSTECHAADRLTSHYNAPSDFSMNLWILAPVVLVVALVLIVKKVA